MIRSRIVQGLSLLKSGQWGEFAEKLAKFARRRIGVLPDPNAPTLFTQWMKNHPVPAQESRTLAADAPLVSVLTPVYNVKEVWLREAIESVLAQRYQRWQLCLVNDASTFPHIRRVLDEYAALDPRIVVQHLTENRGISAASQAALEMAEGELIALLDNDDVLFPHALDMMVGEHLRTGAAWLYSDFVMLEGRALVRPFFKPDFSPERLMSQMYLNHLQVMRKALVLEVGGFRPGFDGSQDFDLALRMMERQPKVAHVRWPLYQWRAVPGSTAQNYHAKPYANDAAKRALKSALVRQGVEGEVHDAPAPGTFRIDSPLLSTPTVSVVGAARGGMNYPAIEWVSDPATAAGEILLFLGNSWRPVSNDPLQRMLRHALRSEIGVVGALLLDGRGRIAHAGIDRDGAFLHRGEWPSAGGSFGSIISEGNVAAVSAECLMIRRALFEEVGGFERTLSPEAQAADLCRRLTLRGYRHVYTGHAVLQRVER